MYDISEKYPSETVSEAVILYDQGVTLKEISNQLGVHRKTVAQWLNKLGVRKPRKRKLIHADDVIDEAIRLYVDEELAIREIAKLLNVYENAIRRWYQIYKIPLRGKHKPGKKLAVFARDQSRYTIPPLDDDVILQAIDLYQNTNLSVPEIAKKTGVSKNSVYRYLHRAEIKLDRRKRGEFIKQHTKTCLLCENEYTGNLYDPTCPDCKKEPNNGNGIKYATLENKKTKQTVYDYLLTEQEGKCAICGILENDAPHKKLSIDHDHTTGDVRGLLCSTCNTALGGFRDDIKNMQKAIEYLA